jgi:hypothetical protein
VQSSRKNEHIMTCKQETSGVAVRPGKRQEFRVLQSVIIIIILIIIIIIIWKLSGAEESALI